VRTRDSVATELHSREASGEAYQSCHRQKGAQAPELHSSEQNESCCLRRARSPATVDPGRVNVTGSSQVVPGDHRRRFGSVSTSSSQVVRTRPKTGRRCSYSNTRGRSHRSRGKKAPPRDEKRYWQRGKPQTTALALSGTERAPELYRNLHCIPDLNVGGPFHSYGAAMFRASGTRYNYIKHLRGRLRGKFLGREVDLTTSGLPI
jgi:hypothetical protein